MLEGFSRLRCMVVVLSYLKREWLPSLRAASSSSRGPWTYNPNQKDSNGNESAGECECGRDGGERANHVGEAVHAWGGGPQSYRDDIALTCCAT
jgi:hypothetical protein